MDPVRYEWDEAKRVANLAKHGLDFARLTRFDWATASIVPDDRRCDYGEAAVRRLRTARRADAVRVVYTHRGRVRRIISLRQGERP